MSNRSTQSGVGMIEVLITIVVISFGFLSLLSMQMNMLTSAAATNQSFLASSLAHDMGERIRANKPGLLSYDGLKTAEFTKDCASVECTIVEEDFFQWKNSIRDGAQGLSAGEGEITAAGGVATITLNWSEKLARQSARELSYSLQVSVE